MLRGFDSVGHDPPVLLPLALNVPFQCCANIHFPSYPKHVWSPAGGWYTQPANWRSNTAVIGVVAIGLVGSAFYYSAQNEHRNKMPEPGRFYPSR